MIWEDMDTTIRFQLKQFIKQAVQNIVLPVCYQIHRGRAVDPKLVIFADAHHDSRPAAMELLYRSLKKSGNYRIVEHYLDYAQASPAAVAKHSIRFMKLYAFAGTVIICDNFLPVASCRKRKETKVVQLWHACGCYKRFGYDAKDDIPEHYHGANVYRNADLVTVSGNAAVRPFASAMRLPGHCVQPVGVSRTDLYFRESWNKRCRAQFYEQYPQARGKKVVLWAPTFRGNAGEADIPPLNLDRLQDALGEEFLVLAKLHPHMLPSLKRMEGGSCALAQRETGSLSAEELYPVVDILIADYSSLIYEYLLFRKPLILFVPDLDEYRSRRGFYMPVEEIPAEIILRETDLPAAVGRAAVTQRSKTDTSAATDAFLARYMGACDGHATDRIQAWIERNELQFTAPKARVAGQ